MAEFEEDQQRSRSALDGEKARQAARLAGKLRAREEAKRRRLEEVCGVVVMW